MSAPSRRLRALAAGVASLLAAAVFDAAGAPPAEIPQLITIAPPAPTPLGCRTTRSEMLCKPRVDTSALPPLPKEWAPSNPYRGNPAVVATGRALFNQTCAFCHGPDADGSNVASADLRRLDAYCIHIEAPDTRAWCERDVDAYFSKTARYGRVTLGIVHMPPWDSTLRQEELWAIKTFIESQKP